jgi:hypothetical protein
LAPKPLANTRLGSHSKPEQLYLLENHQAQEKMRFKWKSLLEKRVIPQLT